MKYFKDKNNNIFALDDWMTSDEWIDVPVTEISEAEADILRIPVLTKEQQIEETEAKKQMLIAEATAAIAPLQDAVDLDMATPEEESALKEWKKYRVMLNRVDTSLGANVVWPTPPASPAR